MIDLEHWVIKEDMERIYSSRKGWKELNCSKLYITGAAGMIASYFTAFLIYLNEEKGYDIEIYAGIRSKTKAENRFGKYINKKYFHVINDDVNLPINNKVYKFDYIVHAASLASPQYYGKMPVETMLPNILGTHYVLDYAVKNSVKGILFFSSGSVYGTVKDDAGSISEKSIGTLDFIASGNEYGESKRCGEALCRAYFNEYAVPVKSARIHHTYGPTIDPINDTRVFSEFVGNILKNKNIVIKSDGAAKRAFCYLSDAIAALYKILLDGTNGESYNVANSTEYITIKELAERLINLYPEKNLKAIFGERKDRGYSPSKEVVIIPVNTEKLELLNWYPDVNVSDGFSRTIQYLSDNIEIE